VQTTTRPASLEADMFQIIASEYVREFVIVPVRVHSPKRKPRGNYHRRIQKKWNKRYGMARNMEYVISGNKVYMHPNNIAVLAAKFGVSA
jgi:stalled ribosome alternative rescue factor ArfA